MSQLDEFNQNNLLFKRFQGVVQTNIVNPNTYDGEFGKEALVNTYNDTIFSSNVTKDLSANNTVSNLALQLPGAPSVNDTSANSWTTGIYGEYSDLKTSQNESVTNLKFYQKVFLKSISSGPYAWWLVDPSNADLSTTNNLLKDMIPFSYGTTGATYSPVVWYYSGTIPISAVDAENKANDPNNWTPDFNQNSTPLYWLVDYASGVLQFYAEADLNGHIPTTGGNKIKPTSNPANWIGGKPDPTSVPRISFIKYVGEKGAAGGGGGGDASGNLDLSGNLSVGGNADISGNLDVSGNLSVVGDASFCNVLVNCDLDVSGNTDMSGNLTVVGDASFCNVLVRCNLDVSGNTDISGNLSLQNNNLMQSVTIEPWTAPNIQGTYYIIATVPESGANALGYFTIQLQEPYYQQVSFYAGVMENKNSVIKVISNSNQDIAPNRKIGFENLKIILFNNVYYLTTTFKRDIQREPIGLLKIILTNNNSNGKDQVNLDRFWTLRDNKDEDWTVNGPEPPEIKAPWTAPPTSMAPPNLPTAQITVPLANLNTIFGGNAHGISSQPEYFQNDIVMGPSGNIVANDGRGTIDICGNLYVDRDASFNRSVHIRSDLDVSNNANIENNLTVGGNLDVTGTIRGRDTLKIDNDVAIGGSLTVDGSGNFGGVVTTVGNTTLVEYIRRNTPSTSKGTYTSPEWFTIAQVDSSSGNTVSSGLFQIIDKTPSIKQILSVIVTFYEGSSEKAAINVISNNWVLPGVSNAPTPPYIRQIRVIDINNIIYLQLDRFGYSTTGGADTTNMDIRLYNNTNANLEYGNIKSADWVLRGNVAEPVGSGTSHALVNLRQGINSSGTASANPTRSNLVTNSYSYMAGGAKIGNTLDMDSNNIENINQIKGSNNHINFNNSGNLRLNAQTKLEFKTNNSSSIEFSNSNLDFQSTNTIENLSNINQTIGDITIGNDANLVTIDASQVEIKSKGGGPPYGDIILNNSGGGKGSIILKNGSNLSGDVTYNTNNFDLSNNTLKVDEIAPSTGNLISFNNNNVSDISNVTTAINFNAKTNMYNDTSGNISSNLTSTGDFGFDTSNKIWTYNDGGANYILANNKRVWFSTSNLPISSYNSGGSPTGISQFNSGFKIIPSEIVNYSMYQDYRNGVGGITDDFTDYGTGFLKYIEVQNDGIIKGGGSKFNNIYITDTQISPTQEDFFVKLNIKPSGGSWGTAQTLQIFPILVNSIGIEDLNGANFTSNISVNSGDLLRIELVFSPSNGAKFIFGQNKIGTATYPETSAGLIATGPRAMFWLDIIEYIPQLP